MTKIIKFTEEELKNLRFILKNFISLSHNYKHIRYADNCGDGNGCESGHCEKCKEVKGE